LYCAYAILIELLIVIVILGVLAAAIIPNLSKFVGSGSVAAANAELASVKTAVSAYSSDNNGVIPTSATGVAPVQAGGGAGIVVNAVLIGANGYIQGTVKGFYRVDATGTVTDARNGTLPLSIVFADVVGSGPMWIKGTGQAAVFAPTP